MYLTTYLQINGITQKQFAKIIDFDVSSVSNWIHCRRRPNASALAMIEKATKGQVTVHDWMAYWEAKKNHG